MMPSLMRGLARQAAPRSARGLSVPPSARPREVTMASARLDRRTLAVLAADVVGYSRLMEADEAGTIARLRAVRAEIADPLIAGHGGRLVKLMGDGALVVFESVVDAVACAVAIQRA